MTEGVGQVFGVGWLEARSIGAAEFRMHPPFGAPRSS